jgi:hypothetical protein
MMRMNTRQHRHRSQRGEVILEMAGKVKGLQVYPPSLIIPYKSCSGRVVQGRLHFLAVLL